MKCFAFLLLLLSINVAQAQQTTFQKIYPGHVNDAHAVELSDKSIVVFGTTYDPFVGMFKSNVTRIDSNGSQIWKKNFNLCLQGADIGYECTNVKPTMLQNTLDDEIFGLASVTVDIPKDGIQYDHPIYFKMDKFGNITWLQYALNPYYCRAQSLQITQTKEIIVSGTNLSIQNDAMLLKMDSSGIMTWKKRYSGQFWGRVMAKASNQNFFLFGKKLAGNNLYLLKTDTAGTPVWARTYSYPHSVSSSDLALTNDQGFILAATATIGNKNNIQLLKADSSGNVQWSFVYSNDSNAVCHSVLQSSNGEYVALGSVKNQGQFGYDVLLIKVDSSGNLVWSKSFANNGGDNGFSVVETKDSGFLVGASTQTPVKGAYVIKTDSTGNSCNQMQANFLAVSITPAMQNDPLPVVTSFFLYDYTHPIISDTNGLLYTLCPACTSAINPTVSTSGNLLISTPAFLYQWHFNAVPISGATDSTYTATQSGSYSVTITDSVGCTTTSQPFNFILAAIDNLNDAQFSIFPNPSRGVFTIHASETGKLTITDLHGRLVADMTIQGGKNTVELRESLPNGIFILKFTSDKNQASLYRKLVLRR
ncbi:MAG TPA: T9SS type A sorting domain-containing protein [Flavipsychrobacter sp.]|nr:T9SS type A sorting domain-containing protein [Flavipsychrobacter sp.]